MEQMDKLRETDCSERVEYFVLLHWKMIQALAKITYKQMDSARRLYEREKRILKILTGREV